MSIILLLLSAMMLSSGVFAQTCDYSINTEALCVAAGGSWMWSSNDCQSCTAPGAYCGDGICYTTETI